MSKGDRSYNSFSDFFASEKIELKREVEVAVHRDENIANNRLFVWNFEEGDLEEFLEHFELYKSGSINITARQNLSGYLMRKMNGMLREGYNPVECMLYASKVVNMRLQNDNELQLILAERIKDIYLKQEAETIAVLNNIIDMWTWIPQIKVVIAAIGLIGDNQELLDKVMINYADDLNFKKKVFYALLEKKTGANLERVLKIIMNLQDTEEDNSLGRAFGKEIAGFGYEGMKLLAKYYDNPAISRVGTRVLKKIMLKEGTISDSSQNNELYRKNLANKSFKDDLAFKDFVNDCYENYDGDAFFLARFSRSDIGSFLKEVLEDERVSGPQRNTAIVSMGIVGYKGYRQAEEILKACEEKGSNKYAVIVAYILLGKGEYAGSLAEIFSQKKDYELSELYRVLQSSGAATNPLAKKIIQEALEEKFIDLLKRKAYTELECMTGNFQIFWDKKLWSLFSFSMLAKMQEVLVLYSGNGTDLPQGVILSLVETVVHSWNSDVERAIFALYKNADDYKVQELAYKKLKERKIEAPK